MCRDKNAIQCGGFDFGSTEAEAAYWERVNEADRIEALYALKQNRHLWPVTRVAESTPQKLCALQN